LRPPPNQGGKTTPQGMRLALQFVLASSAAWRITHLLNAEDGPWQTLARMRGLAGKGVWGELLDCFYCLSLWIAAPLAYWVGRTWSERLLLWPALSGAAILLERVTGPALPVYTEDPPETTKGLIP
jgi:hypothetical protein